MVEPPRRRGAGRSERIARVRASKPHPAFLTRSFPPLRVLSDEGLALIEENADTILQEIGMEFRGDPEVLDILRKAGVDVQGERARFEKGQCRTIIQASAPRSFTQHARNPARSVVIGDPHVVLGPAGGSPFVHDLDRGRRYATTEDFENLLKLCQGIPCIHHAGGLLLALMDKPIPERHLHYIDAQFRFSDKCVLGAADATERAVDSVKMAEIVFEIGRAHV